MFNKDQLIGVLLCLPKPEIHVARADNVGMGYRIRLRLNIRGGEKFLKALERSLLQHNIKCLYKDREHKSRPRPILRISGIVNLHLVAELVDVGLPDAKVMPNSIDYRANEVNQSSVYGIKALYERTGAR